MSTKGKTWKWKEGAKRKWTWKREAKEAKTKYICDDVRIIKCFKWMHDRCIRTGKRVDFPRTSSGFQAFVRELGPIPENMKRPSVGRKNHSKGYVYDNIVWERYEFNVWKNRKDIKETIQELQNNQEEESNEIPF